MNPYLIPGLEFRPDAPLCPHRDRTHHLYYEPVDDTKREFDRFQETISSGRQLTEGGCLVAVTGKSGCGKTSLINRCVAWLHDKLAEERLRAEIFDLADTLPRHPRSIMFRMELVVTELIDRLRDERKGVSPQHIDALRREIERIQRSPDTTEWQDQRFAMVDRVYQYLLRDALPTDRIALILLPPSELVSEIKNYADFARHPRVVFFAETDHVEDIDRVWQEIQLNDRIAPIMLKVGPLSSGDAWTYACARQESDSVDRSFPKVSEETMRRVTASGPISIRWLHKLLYGVYQELASQDQHLLPLPEVSFEHIAGYCMRQMVRSGTMP